MTTDELSAPLGQKRPRKRKFRLPFSGTQAIATLLGLVLLAFAGFALFNDNPQGGEPMVRMAIRPQPAADKPAAPETDKAAKAESHDGAAGGSHDKAAHVEVPGQKTVTIIDGSSGARQQVVVPGGGGDTAASDVAPAITVGIDQKLLEKSRYGMIPMVADGVKPFNAYATAGEADRAKAARMPSIAIVVGGLGVGAAKTNDAIMKLPAAVTLAFTPYGSDPAKLVERARAQRHEVLLQIPMEPFDYPDNDPGPQTLLTTLPSEQNIDRLYWHLSRFQGYIGITNFMGGRFVTTEPALQPIVREAAKRGLGYLDDGQSPRGVAALLATTQTLPFGKADLSIDVVPTALEIDRALYRLESLARDNGNAIGMASALPISIERIATWSRSLEGRGLLLVPLTTAMLKSKSGQAGAP
ncbi:divergent polysaccharide deacetylase family protein [Rhodopseudomonas palustris]|uniref:Divergent polysaccharide deacetylase family protein n=1 Tax=Rhodopseudomonas palustris (strain BisB18) TaxID=316056 RepID=Q21CZ4_RHOPB